MIDEIYGLRKCQLMNLENIDNDSKKYYNYKNLNFLCNLKKGNKFIIIIFHGSVKGYGTDRIIFRGYNYSIHESDIVCISDYLLNVYSEYQVNWTLSTEKYNNLDSIYTEIINYLINSKKYKNIIFTGTSAGGYPSLKFASKYNSIALISNSQIYLEKCLIFNELKEMLSKYNDNLIYSEKNIESILKKSKPKKIILYNNKKDGTYIRDTIPFIDFIYKNKLGDILELNLFDYNGIILKTQHHIQFPNNIKHQQVLSDFISKLLE